MHITVRCPSCRTKYQLNPELRGQRTRCRNELCREIFEIQEEAEASPADDLQASGKAFFQRDMVPEQRTSTGHVGDLVPLVSAEMVPEAEPIPEPQENSPEPVHGGPEAKLLDVPDWKTAPPPVRGTPPAKAEPTSSVDTGTPPPAPAPASESWQSTPPPIRVPRRAAPAIPASAPEVEKNPPAPAEPPTWQTAPPPVRQPATISPNPATEPVATPVPPPQTPEVGPAKVAALPAQPHHQGSRWLFTLLLLVIGAGIVALLVFNPQQPVEDRLRADAEAAWAKPDYRRAKQIYGQLVKDFPESDHLAEYQFLEEYAGVKFKVAIFEVPPDEGRKALEDFLAKHQSNPLLPNYEQSEIRNDYIRLMEKYLQQIQDKKPLEDHLLFIKPILAKAGLMQHEAERRGEPVPEDVRKPFDHLVQEVLAAEQLVAALEKLKKLEPTIANIEKAMQELDPHLRNHPAIQSALKQLLADAVRYVRYQPINREAKVGGPAEEAAPALLICPRLDQPDLKPAPINQVVFALARGVLYALNDADGRLLWFTRVGIDTSELPVRLPASEADKEELVLVLSSDTNTLCARNVRDGLPRWHLELGQPCLGRPLVVRQGNIQRIYLPLVDGRIQEIETVTGLLLGEYRLGLPLRVGGAQQPGSSLLYFPGDRSYVYAIDCLKKQCVGILHSGQPSGSLRGAPIVVADPDRPALPRYLILGQADGLATMKLRAFPLPVSTGSTVLKEEAIRGWSWFPPWCDGEKIVLATDAGVLGLVGINQYRNQDPTLFPMLPQPSGSDEPIRYPQLQGNSQSAGRALVVHAAENDIWVLGHGGLQHWRLGIAPQGLVAGPVWREPVLLGEPLHSGQVSGGKLIVATRSPTGGACLATAVDQATGQIMWQRQLGVVAGADPLALAGAVLLQDSAGGTFLLDPARKPPWKRLDAGTGSGESINIRQGDAIWQLRQAGERLALRCWEAGKPATPAVHFVGAVKGTPGLGPDYLVLPLADGSLLRQPLAGGKGDYGITWRVPHADPGSPGYAVSLGQHDFAISNGSRGLWRLSWPEPKKWHPGKNFELPERIVAPPLVLPPTENDKIPRLVVADASGTLRLLRLEVGTIEELQFWTLGGNVTAGPFLLNGRIGCIIDGRQLMLFDPSRPEPVWTYRPAVESAHIVGLPNLAGEAVLLTDTAGRIVALDTATGQPNGSGYQLRSSAAPAGAALPFGTDQVLVPLTDGTILLVPLADLAKPG